MAKTKEINLFEDQSKLPVNIDELAAGNGIREFLSSTENVDALLDHIRDHATKEVLDAETEEGRKRISAIAGAVSKSKTLLEKTLHEWVQEEAKLAKLYTSNKTKYTKTCDEIRKDVLKPLSDWQEEQDRIAAEKQAVINGIEVLVFDLKEDLSIAPLADRVGLIQVCIDMINEYDLSPAKERIEEAQAAKDDALERLNGMLAVAEKEVVQAEKAEQERIAEIEAKAKADAEAAAEARIKQAELDKAEAEQRAAQEKANAERAAQVAAQQAKDEVELKAKQEREAQELKAQQEAEAKRIASEDLEHRKACNIAAMKALLSLDIGLTESQAQDIVKAAVLGKLERIQMYY